MKTPEIDALLTCALEAAEAGAEELKLRFRKPLEIAFKTSPEDAVTDADLAAEARVREVISRLRPNDSITGEELDAHENPEAQIRWSIDPLDGTVNYTRGITYFATSVAAFDIESGTWVAGAVVAPELDTTYYASRGGGAFVARAGATKQIFGPPPERNTRILATGFSYSAENRLEQFAYLEAIMPNFVDVRRLGSAALDACLVADGTVDAYFERHIKEHDWAAGMLIAEEAGQRVKRPAFAGDFGSINFEVNLASNQ